MALGVLRPTGQPCILDKGKTKFLPIKTSSLSLLFSHTDFDKHLQMAMTALPIKVCFLYKKAALTLFFTIQGGLLE